MALDEIVVHTDDPEEEEEEEEEEEDLVDPFDVLKEACGNSSHCTHLNEKLSTCNDRVNSRSKTEENCSEELFDYLHCVDHCRAEYFEQLYMADRLHSGQLQTTRLHTLALDADSSIFEAAPSVDEVREAVGRPGLTQSLFQKLK